MVEEISTEWLTAILSKNDEENLLSKVIKSEIKSATEKGDNYAGDIKKIQLEVLLKSGKIKRKSLILKQQPTTKYRKLIFERFGITRREIMVYRDVLPPMEDIMRKFRDYTEFMWGRCLYFRMYDQLILNDLTDEGYTMLDRKQGLDLEHCLLVMRSLAKFHAASVKLKELGLFFTEIFTKNVCDDDYCIELNDKFQRDAFIRLANLVDTWGNEWKSIASKLRTDYAPNAMQNIANLMKYDDKLFNVLCHGDCWTNNILFKYGLDDRTPISAKFIDFQRTFFNSPAFDLKYFFGTSPKLEVIKTSLPQLIQVYHNTLTKQLERYSYSGNIITLETLNEEMNRIELFGLSTSITILPIVLLEDTQGIPDMEKLVEDVIESNKLVEQENWVEFYNPSPIFSEFIKEFLSQSIENNSF